MDLVKEAVDAVVRAARSWHKTVSASTIDSLFNSVLTLDAVEKAQKFAQSLAEVPAKIVPPPTFTHDSHLKNELSVPCGICNSKIGVPCKWRKSGRTDSHPQRIWKVTGHSSHAGKKK